MYLFSVSEDTDIPHLPKTPPQRPESARFFLCIFRASPPPQEGEGGEGGGLIEMGAKKGEHIGFRGEHSYLKSMVHESLLLVQF